MKPREFLLLVARDGWCLECGEQEAISPNHRANRGMGGSKLRDRPSNLVILCSEFNSAIESNHKARDLALARGWKLNSWDNPLLIPVYDTYVGASYLLDDNYGRTMIGEEGNYADYQIRT